MRNHSAPTGFLGHLDGGNGFTEGTDLIEFDQNSVGSIFADAASHTFDVGHEQIVAHQLDLAADGLIQQLPAVPVVLGQAVFEDHDGILLHPTGIHIDHLG